MKLLTSLMCVLAVSAFSACGGDDGSSDGGTGGGAGTGGGHAGGGSGGGSTGAGGGTSSAGGGASSAGGGASSAGGGTSSAGGGADIPIAPTVTSTNPSDQETGIALNARPQVIFSVPMDSTTLTMSTFTLQQGSTSVAGTVSSSGSMTRFTPTANLAANTSFTGRVSTAATSLDGLALASPYSWTFVTGSATALGPAPVGLGTAGNFVVLAKTAVSTVPASALTGDIGVSPAAQSFLTGFSLTADASNVFSTSNQVVGKLYAANDAVPTPTRLTTAIGNMQAAYSDAASRPTPDFLELLTGNIGGQTLVPGLYKWTSSVNISTDVTLAGGANDVWIFQTTGDLTEAAAKHVILSGGARAKNIFWQVAGQATLGAGSHFEGIILSKTGITLETGATMNGRALAQTEVALQSATVVQPAP